MKPTQQLHDLGQSLWLDNITREILDDGTLRRYVEEFCVTGLTSNPTIFDQAIGGTGAYDAAIRAKAAAGRSGEALFIELAACLGHGLPFGILTRLRQLANRLTQSLGAIGKALLLSGELAARVFAGRAAGARRFVAEPPFRVGNLLRFQLQIAQRAAPLFRARALHLLLEAAQSFAGF